MKRISFNEGAMEQKNESKTKILLEMFRTVFLLHIRFRIETQPINYRRNLFTIFARFELEKELTKINRNYDGIRM